MRIRMTLVLILFLGCASVAWPAEPADDVKFYQLLQHLARDARQSDFALMLRAVLSGSMMGPGDGWFKPAQSRYDWKWLAERFDTEHKGKISSQDWNAPAALFARLDRDRNGVLAPDDLDWSSKSPYWKQRSQADQWLRRVGVDSDGKLSREDWNKLFEKYAQGKEFLTDDDVRAFLNPPSPPPQFNMPDFPSKAVLFKGLLSGELGSPCEGPKIGDQAPDFKLFTHDGHKLVSLSDYRGKPVVLIFGSFT
jgi:hypothetical protein